MELIIIIYILVFIIFGLVAFSILQLKLAGIKVKDFWSFIQANQMLDKLYVFSKRYDYNENEVNKEWIILIKSKKDYLLN